METTTPNTTYTDEGQVVYEYYIIDVYLMVVFSVISFLGTTGNGLVIWFATFKMKKTVNCVWFLSLAIADFTFALFLHLRVAQLALNYYWPFGTFLCKFQIFALFLNLFASILQLTVISIDRCISVIFPVWCRNHRTPRLAMKVSLAVWTFALAFSLPTFIYTETQDSDDYVECIEDQLSNSGEVIQDHQVIVRFIIFFVIPFAIIVTCYTVIFLRIRRNHMIASTKPFKVIAAVIISFFICWFPYHVFWLMTLSSFTYIQGYLALAFELGFDVVTGLAYANSCVNPFLYVFIGRDFKENFWKSFKPTFERAFCEDNRLAECRRDQDNHRFVESTLISQL